MEIKKQSIAIITCLFLCLLAFPVYALEISYPSLGGITITKDSTVAGYIIYFFNLAIAVGSLIAVVIIVMAGFELLTAPGDVGKIGSGKSKIKNALLGLVILFGSWVLLNTINPQLNTIKIDNLECKQGIQVMTSDNKKVCIEGSTTGFPYEISQTLRWYVDTNTLYKVYTYSDKNYGGTITDVPMGGNILGAKSIFFMTKQPGLYLFDSIGMMPKDKPYPQLVSNSVSNLSSLQWDNLTSSIHIIQPSSDMSVMYQGVAFEDPEYGGKCSFVGGDINDMSAAQGGYYPTPIGRTLSSLVIAKVYMDTLADRGSVILYNSINCGEQASATEKIKSCKIEIGKVDGPKDIYSYCKTNGMASDGKPAPFAEGQDDVLSFKFTGAGGLVLRSSKVGDNSGSCIYRDISNVSSSNGNCYSSLKSDWAVYNPILGGIRPKSFIVFPVGY